MRSGPDEKEVIAVDLVDEEPIRLDVAVAIMFQSPPSGWSL
jgi:hypothetical protein